MTSPSSGAPSPAVPQLTVGYVPGVTLTKWRRIWAERFPRTPLDVVAVAQGEQRSVLDAGGVDLCFARLPLADEGLHAIRLYDEVPVVVVPKDHPLAAFDEVTLSDLAGAPLIDAELADAFDRVAWGAGVLRVPHAIARSHSRRDLVYRPITDAEPTTIALTWLMDHPNELIEEFIGVVRGRTVNSSRTAAARAAKPAPQQAKPAPQQAKRPPAGRSAPPARHGRRRRGH